MSTGQLDSLRRLGLYTHAVSDQMLQLLRLRRATGCCAGLLGAAGGCGELRRAVGGCGELRRAAGGCGGLRGAAGGCGGLQGLPRMNEPAGSCPNCR